MHLIPRIFFRDLRERLIIHFSFKMPIKIQFYLLIVDFSSSIRSFPYLEFSHKCFFFSLFIPVFSFNGQVLFSFTCVITM